jgi:GNAT superfamily N-acetyltransferase
MDFEVRADPTGDELAPVLDGLAHFNEQEVGPANRVSLAVLVKRDGRVCAGLAGYTAWGWFCIEKLWVDQQLRGQGIASKLLAAAEKEASARSCHSAWLDTFNPDALRLYKQAGFTVFGELPTFTAGRTRYFLKKVL